MNSIREKRKQEHIQYALKTGNGPLSPGWEDIYLIHQALLKNDLEEVDTSINFFHKKLKLPIIINAMTGGAVGLEKINRTLAETARDYGLAMAVGSQTAGINNNALCPSYSVVREVNPNGVILANVSAGVKPEIALAAIEMIEADALQLHLNGLQELLMVEGDRHFKDWAENIKKICRLVPVPVIVKEVGNGISWETAKKLSQFGVKGIDTGGSGGTNFAAIELARNPQESLDFFRWWGISSATSLIEVCSLDLALLIIASGGITNSLQIMKALALGANAVGIAGSFLQILIQEGEDAFRTTINNLSAELKMMMLLTGVQNISEIRKLPVVVTGFTREWCEQRSIKVKKRS
jgi:isopentenyl-diphosphate delta-isomerase